MTSLIFSSSPAWFVTGSGMQALAGSTSPAIAALALGIVPSQLGGRVIASLSVVQTITSNVIGLSPSSFSTLLKLQRLNGLSMYNRPISVWGRVFK